MFSDFFKLTDDVKENNTYDGARRAFNQFFEGSYEGYIATGRYKRSEREVVSDGRRTLGRLISSINRGSAWNVERDEDKEPLAGKVFSEEPSPDSLYADIKHFAEGEIKRLVRPEIDERGAVSIDRRKRVQQMNERSSPSLPTISNPYVNRPGVAPLISLFGNAEKEIEVDIYQMQNEAISNSLYQAAKENPQLNITIRIATPQDSNTTGWDILGKNLIEMAKLRELQAEREYLAQFGEVGSVQVIETDRKSHPKLYANEVEGYIGTANLTAPMGSNPEQAGSNYESIRYLTKGRFEKGENGLLLDGVEVRDLGADTASAKLFFQLKNLTSKLSADGREFFTGTPNIGGAGDIYTKFRETLNRAENGGHLALVLNQPFLLQYEDSLYDLQKAGEMGPWRDGYRPEGQREIVYKEQQKRVLNLMIEGRASVLVDNHNYFSRVLEPLYKKLEGLGQGNSLSDWVRGVDIDGSVEERVSNVEKELGVTKTMARQLLAITSGSVKLSTAPMMHVKAFGVFEDRSMDRMDLFGQVSSNLGINSMALQDDQESRERVNREYGLLIDRREQTSHPLGLSKEETELELDMASKHMRHMFRDLTAGQSWWEERVNTGQLSSLYKSLKGLTESIEGASLEWIYGDRGDRKALSLKFNTAAYGLNMGNLSYRLTALTGGLGSGEGMVYMVDQNRYIAGSIAKNEGPSMMRRKRLIAGEEIEVPLAPDQSMKLSPIETATNLFGTAFTEVAFRATQRYKDVRKDEISISQRFVERFVGKKIGDMESNDWALFRINLQTEIWQGAANKLFGVGEKAAPLWSETLGEIAKISSAEDVRSKVDALERFENVFESLIAEVPQLKIEVAKLTTATPTRSIRNFLKSVFEPFLVGGQVSNYSGSQAFHRLPIYELVSGVVDVSTADYLMKPLSYGPASNFGAAGRGADRNVASGGTSGAVVQDAKIRLFGGDTNAAGTVIERAALTEMGIARENTSEMIEDLIRDMERRGLDTSTFEDELRRLEGNITYTFGGAKKVAQLPQRIKNAMGQKGMLPVSPAFTALMQEDIEGRSSRFTAFIESFGSSLKERVRENLKGSEKSKDLFLDRYVTDMDVTLGAVFSAKVRQVLGPTQVSYLNEYRSLLEKSLDDEELIDELVRIRAVKSDLMSGGVKGFTGTDKKTPLIAVQLSGMYTDTYAANEDYWGRQGFVDTTTKGVKASMLSAKSWTLEGSHEILSTRLKATVGDYVTFDDKTGQVVVISGETEKIKTALKVGPDISKEEVLKLYLILAQTVDDRGQRAVLDSIVDNVSRDLGFPSISDLDTKAWNRPGEDSVEVLVGVNRPQGGAGNQMFYELTYARTLLPGGSRRVEGAESGGLFKAPAVMYSGKIFEDIAERANKQRGVSIETGGWSSALGEIKGEDIAGVASVSNLKGFFQSHGAYITRDVEKLDRLFSGLNDRKTALALTMAFGFDFLSPSPQHTEVASPIKLAVQSVRDGQMGEYFKTQMAVYEMTGKGSEYLFTQGAYNIAQTPALKALGADIVSALEGRETGLTQRIYDLLNRGDKPLNMGSISDVQSGVIAGALDLLGQISEGGERPTFDFPTLDRGSYRKLAALMGFSYRDIEDEERFEEIMPTLQAYVKKAPTVFIYGGLSASQSKEPLGSKITGSFEYQHMVRPIYSISKNLQQGGEVARAVGQLLSSISITAWANMPDFEGMDATEVTTEVLSHRSVEYLSPYGSRITPDRAALKEYQSFILDRLKELYREGRVDEMQRLGLIERPRDLAAFGWDVDWTPWEYAFTSMETEARLYATEQDKAFGIGEVGAMLDMSRHKGGIYSMPTITNVGMDEEGRYVFDMDWENKQYAYLPSADMLKQMGTQFGEFTPELARNTLHIVGGFSPMTGSGKVLREMAKAQMQGQREIRLTSQLAQAALTFQERFQAMQDLLADAAAGATAKKAMGGENRMAGGVVIAAPHWLVPEGAMVLPSQATDRAGGGDLSNRLRFQALGNIEAELEKLQEMPNSQLTKLKRKFFYQAEGALREGIGEAGGQIIQDALLKGEKLREEIKALSVLNGEELLDRARGIGEAIEREVQGYKKYNLGTTDRFAVTAAQLHLRSIGTEMGSYLRPVVEPLYKEIEALEEQKRQGQETNSLRQSMESSISVWNRKIEFLSSPTERFQKFATGWSPTSNLQEQWAKIQELETKVLGRDERAELGRLRQTYLRDSGNFHIGRGVYVSVFDSVDTLKDLRDRALASLPDSVSIKEIEERIKEIEGRIPSFSLERVESPLSPEGLRIGDVSLNNLRGALRKNTSINYLDMEKFKHLSTSSIKEVLAERISSASNTFQRTIDFLEQVEESRGQSEEQKRMLSESRETLREGLAALSSLDTSDPKRAVRAFNKALLTYDITDTAQVIAFRSAPFGGASQQKQVFGVIRGVDALNRYLEGNMNEGELAQLSTDRNKTLGLMNPLGMITTNLGDWDGDPYTFIFTRMSDYHRSIERYESNIKLSQQELIETRRGLRESGANEEEIRLATALSKEKITRFTAMKQEALWKLEAIKDDLTADYGGDIKREVANYLGISMDRLAPVGADIAITYLQQGYGLFGGVEGKSQDLMLLSTVFKEIDKGRDMFIPSQWELQGKEYIEGLVSRAKGPEVGYYQAFLESEFIREEMLKQLGKGGSIEEKAAEWQRKTDSMSELFGYMNKAAGVNMEQDSYDMMTRILGKAGSDILGKTYNTLVGTLFKDSPLMALGHIVSSDKEAVLEHLMKDKGEGGLGLSDDAAKAYIANLERQTNEAVETQGFVKSIQQLLRDSIKFKGGTNILDDLKRRADMYANSSGEERSILLRDLAGDLGVGPGLRPLIELDNLAKMQGDSLLNRRGGLFSPSEMSRLSAEFGLSTEAEYSSWQEKASRLMGKPSLTLQEVLNFKIGRELENLSIAFSHSAAGGTITDLYDRDASFVRELHGERIREIWGDEKFSSMSDEEIRKAGLFIEDRKRPNFLGEDYQGLGKFIAYTSIDREVRSVMAGGRGTSEVLSTLPNVIASIRGSLASGKLSPEAIMPVVGATISAFRREAGNLNLSNEDVMRAIFTASNEFDDTTVALLSGAGGTFTSKRGEGKIVRDTFSDYFMGLLKDSALGKQSQAMRKLIQSTTELTGLLGKDWAEELELKGRGVDQKEIEKRAAIVDPTYESLPEAQKRSLEDQIRIQIAAEVDMSAGAMRRTASSSRNVDSMNPAANQDMRLVDAHEVMRKAQGINDGLDLGLGVGLTLLGGLIATGRIESDALTDVAANAFISMGYMKGGDRIASNVAGAGFRAKIAQESGGEDWFATYLAQEVGYKIGADMAAPLVTSFTERVMTGSMKLAGLPIPDITGVKQFRPLDMDRFAAWKGGAQTLGGALLSAVMGSIGAGIGRRAAEAINTPVESSFLSELASVVRHKNQQYEQSMEDQISGLTEIVRDEEGNALEAALEVSFDIDSPLPDRNYFNPESLAFSTDVEMDVD